MIKQEIVIARYQTRNAHAVVNHLNFCMMATTVTWIYIDCTKADPPRRHLVKGQTSFAFSDARRLIVNAELSQDFMGFGQHPQSPTKFIRVAPFAHGGFGADTHDEKDFSDTSVTILS